MRSATWLWLTASVTVVLLLACTPALPAPAAGAGSSAPAPAAPGASAAAPAPAVAAVPPQSPVLATLIEAARKEGQLTLVWSAGILGGSQGATRLVNGLNRAYGLNLSVQYTPGPSPSDLVARLVQEQQTLERRREH